MTPRPNGPRGAAGWASCARPKNVTSRERRVQSVRKAPNRRGRRATISNRVRLGAALGRDWGQPIAEENLGRIALSVVVAQGNVLRASRIGRRPALARTEIAPREPVFLHDRLWKDPVEGRLRRSASWSTIPGGRLTEEYPIRLTTGRRLDSFNTGVQTAGLRVPLRPANRSTRAGDLERYGLEEESAFASCRGAARSRRRCVRHRPAPGLAFMTLHFQDDVATNC